MGDDGVLRSCLVTLGAFMLLVWFLTCSLKKMMATYVFGVVGISGIVLPDWEFFDRDFGQWFSPMPVNRAVSANDRFPRIGRSPLLHADIPSSSPPSSRALIEFSSLWCPLFPHRRHHSHDSSSISSPPHQCHLLSFSSPTPSPSPWTALDFLFPVANCRSLTIADRCHSYVMINDLSSINSSNPKFKFYPLRVALLTTIYSYGLYKWWTIMSN